MWIWGTYNPNWFHHFYMPRCMRPGSILLTVNPDHTDIDGQQFIPFLHGVFLHTWNQTLLFFVKLFLHIQPESPKMAGESKIWRTSCPLCCKPHCQYVTELLQRLVKDGAWGTLYSIKSCILLQYLLKHIRSVFKLIKQLSSLSKVIRGLKLPSPACVHYIHTGVLLGM